MSERKLYPSVMICVVAVLLVCAYVGAYYATVIPYRLSSGKVFPMHRPPWAGEVLLPRTIDRFNVLFAPVHWVDRRLRPHLWNP